MRLTFLGQSGFLLEGERRIVIDPFLGPLEDVVERNRFPRLIDPPIGAERLGSIDVVLISHHHGDHCHVDTVRAIMAASPACRVVTTRSAGDLLVNGGVDANRIVVADLPGWLDLSGIRVFVVPARHYEFSHRPDVMFDYFGFVIDADGRRIYSAGDTIDFPGLSSLLRRLQPTIGLLPVNGRDAAREAMGVIGNLTTHESAALARTVGLDQIVPCHFGMFATNTADPDEIATVLARECPAASIWIPQPGHAIDV